MSKFNKYLKDEVIENPNEQEIKEVMEILKIMQLENKFEDDKKTITHFVATFRATGRIKISNMLIDNIHKDYIDMREYVRHVYGHTQYEYM